jgi:hypothetical protein
MSALFIGLIAFSLLYKNIISPDDKGSVFFVVSDMAIPLFMFYSVILMYFKRRSDKKDSKRPTDEDRAFYNSIGKAEDYNKRK